MRDSPERPETQRALRLVGQLILDGLKHGFFKMEVRCGLEQGKKRLLVVEAGKSYRFHIPESELK